MTRFQSACLLALICFLATIGSAGAQERRKIVVAGAQSLAPLAEEFSQQFRRNHPGTEIEIRGGGSNYAVEAALRSEIDVGLVTRMLTDAEKAKLQSLSIGQDAIILLTYPGNRVTQLTLEQLRAIYLGKTNNWRQLGGEDKGIVALTREQGSALHKTFADHVFGRGFKGQEKAFILRASKGKVLRTIKRIEGSIGYGIVGLDEAESQGVKILAVEGKFPSAENIQRGLYPLSRPQLVISTGAANGAVREWILAFADFVRRKANTPNAS